MPALGALPHNALASFEPLCPCGPIRVPVNPTGTTWGPAQIVYSESGGWGGAAGDANSTIGNGELVVDLETAEIFVFMCRNNSNVLLARERAAKQTPA